MLTHKEELVLSPKRTSSIMLIIQGHRREQFARVAPFMLKTHIFLVLFIFSPYLLANNMPESYLSDN